MNHSMNAGYGLAVRWSLADAPTDVADRLREYVVGTSMAKFMFLDGLGFKTWRMREGEWFEGTYVFDSARERDLFRDEFVEGAADSPGSQIIGQRGKLCGGRIPGGHEGDEGGAALGPGVVESGADAGHAPGLNSGHARTS